MEGFKGRKFFARERNQNEASPATCSFRAEPSKILFSFLEEFLAARESEIVKSILLGGERQRAAAGRLPLVRDF